MKDERWQILFVSLALDALVWIVFGQTLGHDFVNYDDNSYVYQEPHIVGGLSGANVEWAFTHIHSGNWHPLTSLSHMLDCQLWQLQPRGHHLTSVLLHTASAIFLFLALRDLTGRLGRSAFVAAFFAIHPLRVESVAWVAERKDVLSGLFFMLTLLAYSRYARRPSALRYLAVILFFAGGLLAKPMLVTLPCLLLLLDYWPLQRARPFNKLLLEKVPLFLCAAVVAVVTFLAQRGVMSSLESLPFSSRLGNALLAIVSYLREMAWPAGLAVFYPLREQIPWRLALAAAVLVLLVTALVLRAARRRPYALVGWLWYLGMLVPVLGLIQVGRQSHADRYTYLPQIGIALALTWWVADFSRGWKYRRPILSATATAAILPLMWAASVQASYWQNSETLWRHALAVTERNSVAHINLATTLPPRDALPHYRAALALDPDSSFSLNNLAWNLATAPNPALRDGPLAVDYAERANALTGDQDPIYLRTLAATYAEVGRFQDAIATARRALPLAEASGNTALAFDLKNNIIGFSEKDPIRDTSLGD